MTGQGAENKSRATFTPWLCRNEVNTFARPVVWDSLTAVLIADATELLIALNVNGILGTSESEPITAVINLKGIHSVHK